MDKIKFPILCKIRIPSPRTRENFLPPFSHQKTVFFEILFLRNINPGYEIIIKFYDYILKQIFIEKLVLSKFKKFVIGEYPLNILHKIKVKLLENEEWIGIINLLDKIQNPLIEPKYSNYQIHDKFCAVWKSSDDLFTEEKFYQITAGYALNLFCLNNRLMEEENQLIKDLYNFDILNDDLKKNRTVKKKQYVKVEWLDIYEKIEKREPTLLPEFRNSIKITYISNLKVKTSKVEIFSINAGIIKQWDDKILSICGNRNLENGNRSFLCVFLNNLAESTYTEWIDENNTNLYYIMICDVYCRFINIPRPKSIQWMLSTNFEKEENIIERDISLSRLEEFVGSLSLIEYFKEQTEISGPQKTINSKSFWIWIMNYFVKFMDLSYIHIHPRIAVMLRQILTKKLRETIL